MTGHAGTPIALTAPLTESIDHAGFLCEARLSYLAVSNSAWMRTPSTECLSTGSLRGSAWLVHDRPGASIHALVNYPIELFRSTFAVFRIVQFLPLTI
jgi:hypothetical protein